MLACRFVTRAELDALGMGHLVGTSLLRAYMHGFFVHNKLYQKAKAIARPADYAAVRRDRVQAKLEAERQQRITLKRKLPKVRSLSVPLPEQLQGASRLGVDHDGSQPFTVDSLWGHILACYRAFASCVCEHQPTTV